MHLRNHSMLNKRMRLIQLIRTSLLHQPREDKDGANWYLEREVPGQRGKFQIHRCANREAAKEGKERGGKSEQKNLEITERHRPALLHEPREPHLSICPQRV